MNGIFVIIVSLHSGNCSRLSYPWHKPL